MSKNAKKVLSSFMAMVLVITLTMLSSSTVFAASGSKKVTSSGKMSVILSVGETADSSAVSITVSGLPTNAVITKLEVNTGSLSSYNGGVLTNYLTITSSNGRSEQIAWSGATNTTLTTSNFLASAANGTYTITFNATCLGGAVTSAGILDIGTKTYSSPYIVVYWDDTL